MLAAALGSASGLSDGILGMVRPGRRRRSRPCGASRWLGQRVKDGELDVVFGEHTQTFGYVQPDRSQELVELSKEPFWRRIAYRG